MPEFGLTQEDLSIAQMMPENVLAERPYYTQAEPHLYVLKAILLDKEGRLIGGNRAISDAELGMWVGDNKIVGGETIAEAVSRVRERGFHPEYILLLDHRRESTSRKQLFRI